MKSTKLLLSAAVFLSGCPADDDPEMSGDTASTQPNDTEPAVETEAETETLADLDCDMPRPDSAALFSVDLEAWTVNESFTRIDTTCTLDAIAIGATTTLELTCQGDDGELPLPVEFNTPAAGDPAWELGTEVVVDYRYAWGDVSPESSTLTVRDTNGTLLLAGADTGGFTTTELNSLAADVAPILPAADETLCTQGGNDRPMRVAFALDGEEVAVASGEVGVLARADSDDVYSIDLARATHSEELGDSPGQSLLLLVVSVSV